MKVFKVLCSKQLSDDAIIGKVNIDGKVKWVFKYALLAKASRNRNSITITIKYRKSMFGTLDKFAKFIKNKYNIG